MVNVNHLKLCATATHHLGDKVSLCALGDKNLSGITQCPDLQLSLKPCGILSKCTPDHTRDFSFDGDYVDVATCVQNVPLTVAFVFGLVALLAGTAVGGWFGVVRPILRSTSKAQRVAESTLPTRSAKFKGPTRTFADP